MRERQRERELKDVYLTQTIVKVKTVFHIFLEFYAKIGGSVGPYQAKRREN